MKKTKKILSLVLAVIIIVSTIPMAFAEGNTYKVGDIVSFGSYPQSKVTDEALVAELNALAPAWEDWTSYGYYSGDGSFGSMVPGDWMRYTDIVHNKEKYRGVKFTQYRLHETYDDPTDMFSILFAEQNTNGYYINTIYWFKFEPLDWRVLNPNTGLVMSEIIIDAQAYSNAIYSNNSDDRNDYYNDSSCTIYACDYETSSIRKWLNESFINTAFKDSEQKGIYLSLLDNEAGYSTGISSRQTEDKVFLLSRNEVLNPSYGFKELGHELDSAKAIHGSDYAKSQGLSIIDYGNSNWILRSGGLYANHVCGVSYRGATSQYLSYYVYCGGIRPAICVDLDNIENYKHNHSYNSQVTSATCTTQGYTTYTCECGDSYETNYTDILDHKDDNADYLCDYGCGYEFEKPAPDEPEVPDTPDNPDVPDVPDEPDTPDEPTEPETPKEPDEPTDSCTCQCHGNFIQRLIFKFLNFFQKLFGKNKVCACGVKH